MPDSIDPVQWFTTLITREGPLEPRAMAISVVVTFVLSVGLAWLHRRTYRGNSYTQDYAHTMILIAVVSSVMIAFVSNSLAIGLAMFGAFSVIRFPRSLGQPSDLAFMFLAVAVGMVSGTGNHLSALLITVLVGGAIFLLRNAFAPRRATHLLKVSLASDADFEVLLAPVFAEHTDDSRLLQQTPSRDGSQIELRYGLQLKAETRTAPFIEALHHACGNQRLTLVPTGQEFDAER